MNKPANKLLFLAWIVVILIITGLVGFSFTAVRQNYRQAANDPQVELAREVVKAIEDGLPPEDLLQAGAGLDMAVSLSPFAVIFDKDGKVVGSSGKLNGSDPEIPRGTLEFAKAQGKNYFTWEPKDGVRVAAVVLPAKDSFVLVGRNLSEVDGGIRKLSVMGLAAWLVLVGLGTVLVVIFKLLLEGYAAGLWVTLEKDAVGENNLDNSSSNSGD